VTISINGRTIGADAIAAEVQYHPAASHEAAYRQAAQALAVRELLLQRAEVLGHADARRNAECEEEAIAAVIAHDVRIPEPTPEECRRWYDTHREDFTASTLFEAAHILYPAPREDEAARTTARTRAQAALERLAREPALFAEIARAESACSSAADGGHLGQVGPGDTCGEIEAFLFALEEGQICPFPIETKYGIHVLRLLRCVAGQTLPFDDVTAAIADDLKARSFNRAVAQYIALLAGEAEVSGIDLNQASGPLVQ
jgi:peptidyl-prolyl cis-trans isomerase C